MKFIYPFFALLVLSLTAKGAIIYVDPTAQGADNGASWSNAFVDLQDALGTARPIDEVYVAQGTYYPDEGRFQTNNSRFATFFIGDGVKVYGGFPSGGAPFEERDPSQNLTVLSGDVAQNDTLLSNREDNVLHVVSILGGNGSHLEGFRITRGNADYDEPDVSVADLSGAGLYAFDNSNVTIAHCTFIENRAVRLGGAVVSFGGNAFLTSLAFSDCRFVNNEVVAGMGGAVVNLGAKATFSRCVFERNRADGSIEFEGNGGAFVDSDTESIYFNCSFRGNRCDDLGGAGYVRADAEPIFTNCEFVGNFSGDTGGGLICLDSEPTLTNCTFHGNRAIEAVGGFVSAHENTTLRGNRLSNCLFWENSEGGSTSERFSSFLVLGDSEIRNCLAQNWFASELDALDGFFLDSENNLEGVGAANDPRFFREVNPSQAPTVIGDVRFLPNSTLFGRGLNEANSSSTDLAGQSRIQNATIDLGAFEGSPSPSELFAIDFDEDGLSYGVEVALGTEPFIADSGRDENLAISHDPAIDVANLSFGRNLDAPLGTQWILSRSPTLTSGTFVPVFRFDGSTTLFSESGISAQVTDSQFEITDSSQSSSRMFYRFEAEYIEPE